MPIESGITSANAATPTTGSTDLRISSVAYATEERLSEANTASAVGLPSRSWSRLARRRSPDRAAAASRSSRGSAERVGARAPYSALLWCRPPRHLRWPGYILSFGSHDVSAP